MARIRTVKPEYWSSEQVMNCTRNSRLLFIGLWNFADDCGRLADAAVTIKAQVFPGDNDINSENVRGMLDELSANGLLMKYEVDGKAYLQITGWKHQRIDKPQPAKHPPPNSANGRGAFATDLSLSYPNGSYLSKSAEVSKIESARSLAAHPSGALARGLEQVAKRPSEMSRVEIEAAIARKHS